MTTHVIRRGDGEVSADTERRTVGSVGTLGGTLTAPQAPDVPAFAPGLRSTDGEGCVTWVVVFEPIVGSGMDPHVRDAAVSAPRTVDGTGQRGLRSGRRARGAADGGLTPADVATLIDEYQRTGDRRIRNRVIESRLDVADHQVNRFSHAVGVSAEDLRQTALVAMIRAVDRFDSSLGVTFRTFASRTIEGELKRYLRDRAWTVRPPRRSQELYLQVQRSSEELSQRLGRPPTIQEIAGELATEVDRVRDAMEAGRARTATGIDAPGPDGEEHSSPSRTLGVPDVGYDTVEDRMILRRAVSTLDDRQRLVLRLCYSDGLSQPEIAAALGLSQSYVSRLLRGSLEQIRSELVA